LHIVAANPLESLNVSNDQQQAIRSAMKLASHAPALGGMAGVLVGLPVDGRPVVRAQVQQLVALAGWRLQCPEIGQLGHLRKPADCGFLAQWLLQHAPHADGFVISIDMLVYGGLVPSRFIPDDADTLLARLDLLPALKALRPQAPLTAFAATLRISNNRHNEEEKTYWNPHGSDLWAWSFHSDRYQQLGQAQDRQAAEQAAACVPHAVRADYLATRARNLRINQALLDLVAQGVIDRLVLPQDDTAEYGFNIAERRLLQAAVQERGVQDRVRIYPGADEVMHTLCAWTVARLRGDPPLRLEVQATDPTRWMSLRALYEDRPLPQSLQSQLDAVGAVAVHEPAAPPDAVLLVHTQGMAQGDWAMRVPLPASPGVEPAVWSRLGSAPLAVADVAYANGGDPVFMAELARHRNVPQLAAYAGWNTASNRLGSLLAQLVLARGRWQTFDNQTVLALRLAEDLQWQAVLRQQLRDALNEAQTDPEQLAAQAQALMLTQANAWLAAQGFVQRVSRAWLPWQRSFEIGLDIQ
jgi:Protein of unknown function (DUF4127)